MQQSAHLFDILVQRLILYIRSAYDRGGHANISAGNNAAAVGMSQCDENLLVENDLLLLVFRNKSMKQN